MTKAYQDSPVETRRKELPRGDGVWPGFAHVYANIALIDAAIVFLERAKEQIAGRSKEPYIDTGDGLEVTK